MDGGFGEGVEDAEDGSGDDGDEAVLGSWGPGFALGDGGGVEDLDGGEVFGLLLLGGLVFAREHLEEGFVELDLALVADVGEDLAGDLGGGGGDGGTAAAALHGAELSFESADLGAKADDVGVLWGFALEQGFELDLAGAELGAGLVGGGEAGLLLHLGGDDAGVFLGLAEGDLGVGELIFLLDHLLLVVAALERGRADGETLVEQFELGEVGVGYVGGEPGVAGLDGDGDETFALVFDFGGAPEGILGEIELFDFVELDEAELLDEVVGDGVALEHVDVDAGGSAADDIGAGGLEEGGCGGVGGGRQGHEEGDGGGVTGLDDEGEDHHEQGGDERKEEDTPEMTAEEHEEREEIELAGVGIPGSRTRIRGLDWFHEGDAFI